MKKFLSICLSVVLLLSVVATSVVSATSDIPVFDETKPYIKATSEPVVPGEIAKVTFAVGNNKGFWGINQTYKFDKSVLSFVEGETNEYGTFPKVDKGEGFKNSLISPINDKGEFTFVFTEVYNDKEIKTNKSNGELFSIYFKVADDAPFGTYNIDMVDYSAENYLAIAGKPVEFTFNQPSVVVVDPATTTTTTTTKTPTDLPVEPMTAYSFYLENYDETASTFKPTVVTTSNDGSVDIKSDHIQNRYQAYFRAYDKETLALAIRQAYEKFDGFLYADVTVNSAINSYGQECRPSIGISFIDANGVELVSTKQTFDSGESNTIFLDISKIVEEDLFSEIDSVLVEVECYIWGCGNGEGTQPDVKISALKVFSDIGQWPPECDIEINDECLVEVEACKMEAHTFCIKFVPTKTGTYLLTVPDNSIAGISTYDEWGEFIGYFGENGRECYMESGKIYYIQVHSGFDTILEIDNLDTEEKPTKPTESTTTTTTKPVETTTTTTVVEKPSSSVTVPTQSTTTTVTTTTKPVESSTTTTTTEKPVETTTTTTAPAICEHDFNDIVVKNAKKETYFAAGYSGDKVCGNCDTELSKGTTIKKLTLKAPKFKLTSGKKQFKVKYTKVADATGFQVRYRIKGKWITKTYTAKKTVTKAIKKLKKGTYKVQVRAMVKKGKQTAYSKWAKQAKVKVK